MKKIILSHILISLGMLSLNSQAFTLSRDDAEHMMLQCEAIRAQKIEPLKQQAIKDCVTKGKQQSECERYNQSFGQTRHINGKVMPGLFWEEPVCQQALKAEKYFKANPSKKNMPLY